MSMDMHDMTIGVLMGGLSPEREVSLRSGNAMAGALERKGYQVVRIDVGRDLPRVLVAQGVQVAVIALHGEKGEDGTVQGLLELMGIPYTGSGVASSAICMDKVLSKRLFREAGVATPAWRELRLAPEADAAAILGQMAGLPGPWFVKPIGGGSSIGSGRARTEAELLSVVGEASRVSRHLLVEPEVRGAETTLAILDGEAFPLLEIRPEEGYYDYTNKYTSGRTHYLIPPPDMDDATQARVAELGVAAYRALGCRGLARTDVLVEPDGRAWVLEVNTIPGMTETSLAPKAAAARGIGFDDLVERILHGAALDRWDG